MGVPKLSQELVRCFVVQYLVDLDPIAATERCGVAAQEAPRVAKRLMRNPEVKQAVKVEMAKREKRTEINGDDDQIEQVLNFGPEINRLLDAMVPAEGFGVEAGLRIGVWDE